MVSRCMGLLLITRAMSRNTRSFMVSGIDDPLQRREIICVTIIHPLRIVSELLEYLNMATQRRWMNPTSTSKKPLRRVGEIVARHDS